MKTFAIVSGMLALSGLTTSSPVSGPGTFDTVGSTSLERRQGACGAWSADTQLDGDGSPHQRYLHKQLSQTMTCDQENTCSVGESETISYTIGFSLTGGSEVTKWISGGFDVSVSWSTGNQYTCNGGPSDTVCIWQKVAHTAYKVETGSYNQCTGFSPSGKAEISSPNDNNAGGGFYCVVGTCRNQGDEYWEN